MRGDAARPERPHDLPDEIGDALESHASNATALREAVIYAQELLNAHHEPRLAVEPREGEEILEVSDHGDYTSVVKRRQGQRDAFLYHVRREPRPDGDEQLRWVLMGRVDPEER